MDLSKFDLSEEVTAAIQAEFTKETEGLRNKNEQLLGEKKTIQGSGCRAGADCRGRKTSSS